jgi:hypothetical protein
VQTIMGGGGGADTDVDGAVNKANGYLQDALTLGLPYSENFTKQAIQAQQQAQNLARNDAEGGFQRSQGLNAPYRLAGYQALDSYMDTLTMARPEMGSFKLANALESAAHRDQALGKLSYDVQNVKQYYDPVSMQGKAPDSTFDPSDPQYANDPRYQGMADYPDGKGGTVKGPVGLLSGNGTYSPGVWAENALKTAEWQIANNFYQNPNLAADNWNSMPTGSGGIAPASTWGVPMGGYAKQAGQARAALGTALDEYNRATQYYTPEHQLIANSFNRGLLGEAKWKDVPNG